MAAAGRAEIINHFLKTSMLDIFEQVKAGFVRSDYYTFSLQAN